MRRSPPKIGRNDPCPCGHGRKYKYCCLGTASKVDEIPTTEILEAMRASMAARATHQRLRETRYGKVRPIISADYRGFKVVVEGSTVHLNKEAKTFIDFLSANVKQQFGQEWWQSQKTLPEDKQSPIYRWARQATQYQRNHGREEGDLVAVDPSGPMLAYLTIAYDLYVLKDNLSLQTEVLERMKFRDFYGARHELFVAATFIRAGFEIRYENEKDNSTKHPEFVATHRETGIEIDVEAKKRVRLRKLTSDTFDSGNARIDVRNLLASAYGKFRRRPYVIVLDIDTPPFGPGNPLEKPWSEELKATIEDAGPNGPDEKARFNLIVFTNSPTEYEIDKAGTFQHIDVVSLNPSIELSTAKVIDDVRTAIDQFGKIPSFFNE